MSTPSESIPEPRPSSGAAAVLLGLAAVGAGTSALLLHEYLVPRGGACGPGGGCDTVRSSVYSAVAGVPLPALGLLFFLAFGVALLVPRLRVRRLPVVLGVAGGLTALVLLGLQGLVIGAWCPYCVVVDACALGLAAAALMPSLSSPRLRIAGPAPVAIAVVGVALPIAIGQHTRSEVPPPVLAAMPDEIAEGATRGQAMIVEFVDFECPFCRRQHARLASILPDYGERVEVVYRHVPLAMHPHARDAARVACCAEEQGMGDRVADALFHGRDLTYEGCLACAEGVGLDAEALRQCLESDRPESRLGADQARAQRAGIRALPTCFIGEQRFDGLQDEKTLREAIERELARIDQTT